MNSRKLFPVQCAECSEHSTCVSFPAAVIAGIFTAIAAIAAFGAFFALFLYGIWAGVFSIWLIGIFVMPVHLFGAAKPIGASRFGPITPLKVAVFNAGWLLLIFFLRKYLSFPLGNQS